MKISTRGIWGFVLSLVSLIILPGLGILGIIFSALEISRFKGWKKAPGLSKAGLICGIISTAWLVIIILFIFLAIVIM